MLDFVPELEFWRIEVLKVCYWFWNFSDNPSHVSPKKGRLDFFRQGSSQKIFIFQQDWVRKTIIFIPALEFWNFDCSKFLGLLSRWTHLDFQTLIFSKLLIWYLPSETQSNAVHKYWSIRTKVSDFFSMHWTLMDQKRQKVLLILICLLIQTQIPPTLPARFFDVFYLRRNISFQRSWNFSSTSECELWLAKTGKSALSLDISQYYKSSISITTALNSTIKVWIDAVILSEVRWHL